MFQPLISGLKQLVFPDNCLHCKSFLNSRHTRQLCDACLTNIRRNIPPFKPIENRHYDCAWSACIYEGILRDLLHAFKYSSKTALRKTFTMILIEFIDTYHIPVHQFDIVSPIPLHPVKLRERGFNQSLLLSEPISQHYQLSHQPDLLERIRPTETQTVLDQKQRFTNLEGAFRISPSKRIPDKSVLLIDDLLTSGATVDAAAAALKDAGASYVGVLTLGSTE